MLKNFVLMLMLSQLFSCATTSKEPLPPEAFHMTSQDPSYGYRKNNPIELGGFLWGTKFEGSHIQYFEGLMGPNGEQVRVQRLGSCCEFIDSSMPMGGGLLDMYQLSYDGIPEPKVIYVNLYKFKKPMAPKNFVLE